VLWIDHGDFDLEGMREYRVEVTMSERFAKVALMDGNQMTPKIEQTNMQDGKNQG